MKRTTATFVALGAVVLLTLTGCAGGSGGGSTPVTADTASAQTAIEPYVGPRGAFPISEPLLTRPEGARIAVIDCGTPTCALLADLTVKPAEALGMTVTRIQSGTSADTIATAFNTIISGGYKGVIVPALPFSLWERSYTQLVDAGIAVAVNGVTGLPPEVPVLGGDKLNARTGALMADWVVANVADPAHTVIYETPELPFTTVAANAYVSRMSELCAGCEARVVDIPVSAIGSTAPQQVVDDLTAHPETTAASFSIGEQATGLPAALKTAGIEVTTLLQAPGPAQLTDVQNGDLTAALAADFFYQMWALVDTVARQIVGQPVAASVTDDVGVNQFVTAADLKGLDMSTGWVGYPDDADRFLALWPASK